MKKIFLTFLFTLFASTAMFAQVDKLLGEWKTVDDKTNKEVSVVQIYKAENGLYYGKLIKLLEPNPDTKLIGTMIIKDMEVKGDKLVNGTVYDPDNGKTYYASVKYNAKNNTLILRGSLDKKGIFGRSQTWVR